MKKVKRHYKKSELTLMRNMRENSEPICYYCNKRIEVAYNVSVDHKDRYSVGNTIPENLVISCRDCNKEKGAMSEQEYYKYLSFKKEMSKLSKEEINFHLERNVSLLRTYDCRKLKWLRYETKALERLSKEK